MRANVCPKCGIEIISVEICGVKVKTCGLIKEPDWVVLDSDSDECPMAISDNKLNSLDPKEAS